MEELLTYTYEYTRVSDKELIHAVYRECILLATEYRRYTSSYKSKHEQTQ